MVLVDTSVWVDHLRRGNRELARLLDASAVLTHPFVIGELALGTLRQRAMVLALLGGLPTVTVANHSEILRYIEEHTLAGQGIGYVDAHLLAAVQLTPGALLWTRDRRLGAAAEKLGFAYA